MGQWACPDTHAQVWGILKNKQLCLYAQTQLSTAFASDLPAVASVSTTTPYCHFHDLFCFSYANQMLDDWIVEEGKVQDS